MAELSTAALVVAELRAAILSVTGPWMDLSDISKLTVSNSPLTSYEDVPNEKLPMVLLYTPADTTANAATARHEITTPVMISIISRPVALDRSVDLPNIRTVGRQIVRNLFNRQTLGDALVPIHLANDPAIDAECPLQTISCSIKFTVTHLEAQ